MTAPAPPTAAEECAALSIKQQDSILDSAARLNIWEGAIRSSKTVASIMRWLMYVRTAPKGPLAVIGKTRDTIARNVLDDIADIAPGAINFTAGAPRCRILGRLVHIIGANDKKAEKALRGLTLAGAYVDGESFLIRAGRRYATRADAESAITTDRRRYHWSTAPAEPEYVVETRTMTRSVWA